MAKDSAYDAAMERLNSQIDDLTRAKKALMDAHDSAQSTTTLTGKKRGRKRKTGLPQSDTGNSSGE